MAQIESKWIIDGSGNDLDTALALKLETSLKGSVNGLAELDASGLLKTSQLPPLAITSTFVVANEAAQLALTVQEGDVAVRSDENKNYIALNATNAAMSDWQVLLTPTDAVLSVNGATGVVVLDTDDLAEGTNLFYTQGRFDSAFTAKSTTDLSEGSNLYHTVARAKAAAVVNSTAGSETDQAPSVASIKAYVDASTGSTNGREIFTLVALDISNGYVDLAQTPIAESLMIFPVGGPMQEFTADFTVSTNRITFAGDLAANLIATEKLVIQYEY